MRGMLTEDVQHMAKKFLRREISVEELRLYYSKGDLNEIIKNTRKAFMEEIFEELDKYYPPENQKIHKYDIKEIISDIIKKMENYFESPESIEEELEVIYNKSKY